MPRTCHIAACLKWPPCTVFNACHSSEKKNLQTMLGSPTSLHAVVVYGFVVCGGIVVHNKVEVRRRTVQVETSAVVLAVQLQEFATSPTGPSLREEASGSTGPWHNELSNYACRESDRFRGFRDSQV